MKGEEIWYGLHKFSNGSAVSVLQIRGPGCKTALGIKLICFILSQE